MRRERTARRLAAAAGVALCLAGCNAFLDGVPEPKPEDEVRAYMTDALDIMQTYSINKYRIDWPRFRADALARVGGVTTVSDAYPAVAATVRLLGDSHSSFIVPANAAPTDSPSPATQPIGKLLDARIAYVDVPAFSGTNAVARADSIQEIVKALDKGPVCGWVVDLRGNGGGNMYPMIAGLGPLLGEGQAGSFVDPDNVRSDWIYRAGAVSVRANGVESVAIRASAPYTPRDATPPVAVLYGARTASSGEATAISFRGRADARSFGMPTAGLSTANRGFRMRDGAILNLTTATMADRTGRAYGGKLAPDEQIANPAVVARGEIDDVVRAAMTWLAAQPSCAGG
jgi:carboxyl-terminal processing protease